MFLQDVSINFDMLIRVFFLQKLVHLMVLREGEEKKEGRMTFGLRGGNSLSFLSRSLDGLGGTPSIHPSIHPSDQHTQENGTCWAHSAMRGHEKLRGR